MPNFDATAKAALEQPVVRQIYFAWLDIVGLPIRATTAEADVVVAGSGDTELDGTYEALDPRFVEVGDVVYQDGGSDTLRCRLSGILDVDSVLMTAMGNRANWHGRTARLWIRIRDEHRANQGAIAPYYTGSMLALDYRPGPDSQTIELVIENYKALLTRASNRSYLNQKDYDPADQSAAASIGAGPGAKTGGSGGGGGLPGKGFAGMIGRLVAK